MTYKIKLIPKLKTRDIIIIALLMALQIVLRRFSLHFSILEIGADFIPAAIIGMTYGPFWGGIEGVIADLIGNTIFSSGSTFFFGYTLSALLVGVIYGLFLYPNRDKLKNIILSEVVISVFVNIILGTLWLYIMLYSGKSNSNQIWTIFGIRIVKNIISCPIHIIALTYILPIFKQIVQKPKSIK